MGEIADLMINGDICEGCGCELDGEGNGFPRRCSGCGGNARDFDPMPRKTHKPDATPLPAKQVNWLKEAARKGLGAEYDGERWDSAPAQFAKLERRGYVVCWHPHNPAHMPRAIITEAGRVALKKAAL